LHIEYLAVTDDTATKVPRDIVSHSGGFVGYRRRPVTQAYRFLLSRIIVPIFSDFTP
jgi:hypothetical protein